MMRNQICAAGLALVMALATAGCAQTGDPAGEPPAADSPASSPASPAVEEDENGPGDFAGEDDREQDSPDGRELEEIYETYLLPLGLTGAIGWQWLSPAELDPDSVLITLEIQILEDQALVDSYEADGDLRIPREDAEHYAAQSFGMTPEQLRESRYYDGEGELYVVPIGLGGAWGTEATGFAPTDTGLEVFYNIVDSWGYPSAHGVMRIALRPDGSHQYLSNTVVTEIYALLRFPSATDYEVSEGRATMNSGGISASGPDADHLTTYDGGNLEEVVAYCLEGLEQAGATGEADPDRYEEGWCWQGTYDGKPLTVEILPRDGEEDYTITILF